MAFAKTLFSFGKLCGGRCRGTSAPREAGRWMKSRKARFIATFMAFLSYSQNAFLKWREKMLEPPLWMGWELLIMNLVSSPGGKEFWKERGYLFGEEFRRQVEDDLMKRTPHPDAKPMGAFPIGQPAK